MIIIIIIEMSQRDNKRRKIDTSNESNDSDKIIMLINNQSNQPLNQPLNQTLNQTLNQSLNQKEKMVFLIRYYTILMEILLLN